MTRDERNREAREKEARQRELFESSPRYRLFARCKRALLNKETMRKAPGTSTASRSDDYLRSLREIGALMWSERELSEDELWTGVRLVLEVAAALLEGPPYLREGLDRDVAETLLAAEVMLT